MPDQFDPDYFANHTENIWLFPDWPFFHPDGIKEGDMVQVANEPDFSDYVESKYYGSHIEMAYDKEPVDVTEGFTWQMPVNHRAWPVHRTDELFTTYKYIRLVSSDQAQPDPDPVPDPLHDISRAAQTGFLNQMTNVLTGTDPADVATSHANMLKDRVNKQAIVDSIRLDLKELTQLRKNQ